MKKRKVNKSHAIRIFTFFVLLFLTKNLLQAQVFTRILGEKEKIETYLPWYFSEKPDSIIAPPVDVQATLAQDEIDSLDLPRFGIKESIGLNEQDGTFFEFGNYFVWKLRIHSDGAKSLNFEFTNLHLPEGSEMFIYGMNNRMIHGPILAKNVTNGVYSSDIVNGETANIEVFLPDKSNEKFSINIDNLIHGIKKPGGAKGFGDSLPCNVNVTCNEGNGWENEIAAVCLILRGGTEWCTGTLINDECSDFTPYLLTANHCVTGFNSFNWAFRFNYESLTCPVTTEPSSSLWISFSGAQLRANWGDSDFALLELNNPVIGTGLAFAGWDRSANVPTNSTFIHHPQGDVKKITVDAQPPIIETANIPGSPLAPNMSFRIELDDGNNGDFGVLQGGSSGCAQFNQAHRIVGQNWGGDIPGCISAFNKWEGRFFNSWNGNGTDNTRLSSWLGGVNNPLTLNGSLIPSISGDDVLCTTNKTYTLQNPVPGYSVTWSVSPTSLFGSATSGTGTTAVLRAVNNNAQGEATLTFTLSNANCSNQQFTKTIWVGKPANPVVSVPGCFTIASNVVIHISSSQGATNFTWTFPTCPNGPPGGDPDPECWFNYTGNGPGTTIFAYVGQQGGNISLFASNECGSTSIALPIEFCPGGPGGGPIIKSYSNDDVHLDENPADRIVTYPNPANGNFTLELNPPFYPVEELRSIQLLNMGGRSIYNKTFSGNKLRIDVNDFSPGIYFLKVQYRGDFIFRKIIIL